jgi:hypothetical protein
MDLGMTALGNWKAQQGGCTHIQVTSPTPILVRNRRVSQPGRIPPFFSPSLPTCSSSTRSMTSSTFPFLPLPQLHRTDLQEPAAAAPPDFCFRFLFKVHELQHGILKALPQAKPSHGGARCPRIAYTADISCIRRRSSSFPSSCAYSKSHRIAPQSL